MGGQQPVPGATVQLYAISQVSDGGQATPLLRIPVFSNSVGGFNITGNYSCPDGNTLVYLTATGGNPGLGTATNNQALALMTTLGYCGDLKSNTFINVNELTTDAAVQSLAHYMTSYHAIGAVPAELPVLSAGFEISQMMVDPSTGSVPGATIVLGYNAPVTQINTLADVIASCVNSAGGIAGDGTPCGKMFSTTTSSIGTVPKDTVEALLQIAAAPEANVASIFNLVDADAPFVPTLPSPPTSWYFSLQPSGASGLPRRSSLLGEYLLNEGSGLIAHDTSGRGNDAAINGPTWEGSIDLDFRTPGDYVVLPSQVNSARSWQFAFYNPPFGNGQYPLPPGYGGPLDYGFNPTLLTGSDGDHLTLGANSVGGKGYRFWALRTDGTESSDFFPVGWHVLTMMCGSSANGIAAKSHYLYDGREVSGYVVQGDASTCSSPSAGNFQLGGSAFYPYGTWFVGKIASVWAWSTPLSVPEGSIAAQAALNYLRVKGVPQTFRRRASNQPLVLAGLDSRTEGVGLTRDQAWPANLALTDETYLVSNLGFSAQVTLDACNQFPLTYGAQINGSSAVIVAVWGGVNDIEFTHQTARQIADNLKCIVQQAKSDGAQVVLATEISSLTNGSVQGDIQKNA